MLAIGRWACEHPRLKEREGEQGHSSHCKTPTPPFPGTCLHVVEEVGQLVLTQEKHVSALGSRCVRGFV